MWMFIAIKAESDSRWQRAIDLSSRQYICDLQLEVLVPSHLDLITPGYTIVKHNLTPGAIVLWRRLQPVHTNSRFCMSKIGSA